jgi:hypothetical protein
MNTIGKTLGRRLLRRGVLVQDRDGRIRRMVIDRRRSMLERLQAAILRITLAEQLPV